MRLKIAAATAKEQLTVLITEGYEIIDEIRKDHTAKGAKGTFDDSKDNEPYFEKVNQWGTHVIETLTSIFPTELEAYTFANPDVAGMRGVSGDYNFGSLVLRAQDLVRGLDKIMRERIQEYTDLPTKNRLFVEDIESFAKVRDVNPAMVDEVIDEEGYLDLPEDRIQRALEEILTVPFHKEDWGGEQNDLYTGNMIVNGGRSPAAFLLKGNGLRKNKMEIRDCGRNGDQLVRLFQSPAQVFVVQFVGNISESVISDCETKVRAIRAEGKDACYCIIDGQDTARLLKAYGKV